MTDILFEKKWLQTETGRICYFFNRDFPGRPVAIFVHGLSANHTTLRETARRLHALRTNCLLLDLRGHGYSDKTIDKSLYKFPIFSRDLAGIMEQEKISQALLIGYSFGGYIAQQFAVEHPSSVLALILISSGHVNPLKYLHLSWLTWPVYGFLRSLAWLLSWQKRKNYFYFDQEKSHGYFASSFIGLTTMPVAVNFWMLSEIAHLDFSRNLAALACPTLIIKGRADLFLSEKETREMTAKIPDARVSVIQEDTHFLASRYKDKLNEVLVDFLKQRNFI